MTALVEARRKEGFSPVLVPAEEIYDEFAFGRPGPEPLRRFLEHASRTWRVRPRAVLLVGDASFDPRGFLGPARPDLLPTKLVDTNLLETASDDWLVDFDDDGVPDVPIGRLPVRTAEEASQLASSHTSPRCRAARP